MRTWFIELRTNMTFIEKIWVMFFATGLMVYVWGWVELAETQNALNTLIATGTPVRTTDLGEGVTDYVLLAIWLGTLVYLFFGSKIKFLKKKAQKPYVSLVEHERLQSNFPSPAPVTTELDAYQLGYYCGVNKKHTENGIPENLMKSYILGFQDGHEGIPNSVSELNSTYDV